MATALAQPHRRGLAYHPAETWRTTALGLLIQSWGPSERQRDIWLVGERYAQMVDAERIARGLPPRQCAEQITAGSEFTLEEQYRRRADLADALRDADRAMLGGPAKVVRRIAWEDLPVAPHEEPWAKLGLTRLEVHFETIDKPRRRV